MSGSIRHTHAQTRTARVGRGRCCRTQFVVNEQLTGDMNNGGSTEDVFEDASQRFQVDNPLR